jgi:hypothetical protein
MMGTYLMLNTPTPVTDWGPHGPTTEAYDVRTGHGEGPRSSFMGAVLPTPTPSDPRIGI